MRKKTVLYGTTLALTALILCWALACAAAPDSGAQTTPAPAASPAASPEPVPAPPLPAVSGVSGAADPAPGAPEPAPVAETPASTPEPESVAEAGSTPPAPEPAPVAETPASTPEPESVAEAGSTPPAPEPEPVAEAGSKTPAPAASPPAPAPQPAAPPPVAAADPDDAPADAADLDALDAAARRAAQVRRLAADFNSARYFPEDWKAADDQYVQADRLKKTVTRRDVRDSVARYEAAAGALEALADRAYARYAQEIETAALLARGAALDAGAEAVAAAELREADGLAPGIRRSGESKDYYAARDQAVVRRDLYEALEAVTRARALRREIAERDLARYNPGEVARADETLRDGRDDYEAHNAAAAQTKAEDALEIYDEALRAGLRALAEERRAAAAAERLRVFQTVAGDAAAGTVVTGASNAETVAAAFAAAMAAFTGDAGVMGAAVGEAGAAVAVAETVFTGGDGDGDGDGDLDGSGDGETAVGRAVAAFAAAEAVFTDGGAAFDQEDYETAARRYDEALPLYTAAAEAAERAARRAATLRVDAQRADADAAERADADRDAEAAAGAETLSAAAAAPARPAPPETPAPGPALPARYLVRTWNEFRDCLWNIAGQDWAYDDPTRWPALYEANRDKLPEPDNPHLILPGMILEIPSVDGEVRDGFWDPAADYQAARERRR